MNHISVGITLKLALGSVVVQYKGLREFYLDQKHIGSRERSIFLKITSVFYCSYETSFIRTCTILLEK